ncbi:MAG: hypothetical protein AB1Z19_08100 [Eubacteriales bacterium]
MMLEMYNEWYVDRDNAQLDLYQFFSKELGVKSVLYPGSFVHISPSFFIPYACYVDMDKKARRFFKDTSGIAKEVNKKVTTYAEKTTIKFYPQDYTKPIDEPDESFDLLVSQYAGFICQPCKRYLKPEKYLLVNNSHGDAGIAALDEDYTLVQAINRRDGLFKFSDKNLDQYFIPKKLEQNSMSYIQSIGKGIAYTKTAFLYLFQLKNSAER